MTGHIFIYGEIGRGIGQVSVRNVQSQIEPGKSDYVLHLISPGGDVFEGFGIYNLLKNTGKKITTHIEGVTASIATLIAFAGEKLIMNKTAEFMIHNPYITDLKGDSEDLKNAATQLDKIKSLLIDVSGRRAIRNGKSMTTEELSALYDRETWLTSTEAYNMGFVDEVQDAIRAVATIDLKRIKMEKNDGWIKSALSKLFKNKSFKNEFTETLEDGTKVVVMSEDGDWTNKPIMTEAGDQMAPGDYKLSSGKVITVGDGSTITQVTEAAPVDNAEKPKEENTEDMTKIQELEAQLAAAKAGQAAAEAKASEVAAAQSQLSAKFENKFKELEAKMSETVGEKPNLKKGPSFINLDDPAREYDPMGEYALEVLTSRNRLTA